MRSLSLIAPAPLARRLPTRLFSEMDAVFAHVFGASPFAVPPLGSVVPTVRLERWGRGRSPQRDVRVVVSSAGGPLDHAYAIAEAPDATVVQLDVPGIRPADLTVTAEEDAVHVTGIRRRPLAAAASHPTDAGTPDHAGETRAAGDATAAADQTAAAPADAAAACQSLRWVIAVPPSLDPAGVTASLAHGVLELRIPARPAPEPPAARHIPVQSA